MKQITVLSGKGGVGKSSIAASLAIVFGKKFDLVAADCDVDASNLALVFGKKEKDFSEWKEITTNEKAVIDEKKCTKCKKCVNSCYFHAINWNEKQKIPEIDSFSCEGCGMCELVCPEKAIRLVEVQNAKIGFAETSYGFKVVSAQLKMGESGSGKVVAEVKKLARKISPKADLMIIDAAAGIGCPVIASVVGSDYVIGVTEPSPSALSDLQRALQLAKHFGIPAGLIINKFDLNKKFSEKIEAFAQKNNLEIIGKIPYNKSFVDALIQLKPVIELNSEIKQLFEKFAEKIGRNI